MASKNDDRAAGDIFPPLPKVNSLQALMRLRPKRGSEWNTFAFVLNRDMIGQDGKLDDLHAVVFPLGGFSEQDKAEEHAKNVIAITGHPAVIAARYGTPVKLSTKFDPSTVVEVPIDMKGRIVEMESVQYKQEREEYEKRAKIEREVMKEAEEETDPDNIEHFKRQCYLAIKNRASYQVHTKEADAAWENYKKREMAVRDHFARHPDHEAQWLPYLKEKLTERGELNLYIGIENAYKELREEMLGLIESSDEDSEDDTQIIRTMESFPCESTQKISKDKAVAKCQPNIIETSKTSYPDNILCECPGGICLGRSSENENINPCDTSHGSSGEVCFEPKISEKTPEASLIIPLECSDKICMVKDARGLPSVNRSLIDPLELPLTALEIAELPLVKDLKDLPTGPPLVVLEKEYVQESTDEKSQINSSDSECSEGVCMASPRSRESPILKSNMQQKNIDDQDDSMTDEIIASSDLIEHVPSVQVSTLEDKDIAVIEEPDDDIIAPEAIMQDEIKESVVTMEDPGFIDEDIDDTKKPNPMINRQNQTNKRGNKRNKRGKRHGK